MFQYYDRSTHTGATLTGYRNNAHVSNVNHNALTSAQRQNDVKSNNNISPFTGFGPTSAMAAPNWQASPFLFSYQSNNNMMSSPVAASNGVQLSDMRGAGNAGNAFRHSPLAPCAVQSRSNGRNTKRLRTDINATAVDSSSSANRQTVSDVTNVPLPPISVSFMTNNASATQQMQFATSHPNGDASAGAHYMPQPWPVAYGSYAEPTLSSTALSPPHSDASRAAYLLMRDHCRQVGYDLVMNSHGGYGLVNRSQAAAATAATSSSAAAQSSEAGSVPDVPAPLYVQDIHGTVLGTTIGDAQYNQPVASQQNGVDSALNSQPPINQGQAFMANSENTSQYDVNTASVPAHNIQPIAMQEPALLPPSAVQENQQVSHAMPEQFSSPVPNYGSMGPVDAAQCGQYASAYSTFAPGQVTPGQYPSPQFAPQSGYYSPQYAPSMPAAAAVHQPCLQPSSNHESMQMPVAPNNQPNVDAGSTHAPAQSHHPQEQQTSRYAPEVEMISDDSLSPLIDPPLAMAWVTSAGLM